jgi:acyl-CoA synthetase (AMP-forming)/AMP-acid ligase II
VVRRIQRRVLRVKEAAVVARPDADYGEVALAYVLLQPGAPSDIAERVLEHCRASLAKFKVPREVVVLEEFPRIGFVDSQHHSRLGHVFGEPAVKFQL